MSAARSLLLSRLPGHVTGPAPPGRRSCAGCRLPSATVGRKPPVTRLFLLTVTRAPPRSAPGRGAPSAPAGPGTRARTASPVPRRPACTDPSGTPGEDGFPGRGKRPEQCAYQRGSARYGPVRARVQTTGRTPARTPCDAFAPSGAVSNRGPSAALRERRPGPLLWGVAAPAVLSLLALRPGTLRGVGDQRGQRVTNRLSHAELVRAADATGSSRHPASPGTANCDTFCGI